MVIRCKIFTQVSVRNISHNHVDTRKPVDEDCIAFLSRETLRGIAYMHSQGKIHRDIKVRKLFEFELIHQCFVFWALVLAIII